MMLRLALGENPEKSPFEASWRRFSVRLLIGLVARGRCCAYRELHFGLFGVPELKKRGAEQRLKGTLDARC